MSYYVHDFLYLFCKKISDYTPSSFDYYYYNNAGFFYWPNICIYITITFDQTKYYLVNHQIISVTCAVYHWDKILCV